MDTKELVKSLCYGDLESDECGVCGEKVAVILPRTYGADISGKCVCCGTNHKIQVDSEGGDCWWEIVLTDKQRAALYKLAGLETKHITATAVNHIIEMMLDPNHRHYGKMPNAIAEEEGLWTVTDEDIVGKWVSEAIEANPGAAEDVLAGKEKALGFLVGQVMQMSGKAADPVQVRRRLRERLNGKESKQ